MKLYQKFSLFLSFLTAIFIFYMSSKSNPPNPVSEFPYAAIIYHFSIFFLFSFFLFLSFSTKKRILIISLFLSFVYAALDEMHQYFVPGRNAALSDFGIDCLGSILSLVFILLFKKSKFLKSTKIQKID